MIAPPSTTATEPITAAIRRALHDDAFGASG